MPACSFTRQVCCLSSVGIACLPLINLTQLYLYNCTVFSSAKDLLLHGRCVSTDLLLLVELPACQAGQLDRGLNTDAKLFSSA